jgi:hypothetical protein
MLRLNILLVIITSLSSCTPAVKEMVLSNDLEQLSCWYSTPEVQFGKGHSGYYFSPTDSIRPVSITFKRQVKDLGPEQMSAAVISAWVRPEEAGASGELVLSVERGDQVVQTFSISSTGQKTELHQWTRLEQTVEFSADLNHEDVLKVYVKNDSKRKLDVDDFEIRFQYR